MKLSTLGLLVSVPVVFGDATESEVRNQLGTIPCPRTDVVSLSVVPPLVQYNRANQNVNLRGQSDYVLNNSTENNGSSKSSNESAIEIALQETTKKWEVGVEKLLIEAISRHSDGAVSSVSQTASRLDEFIDQNDLITGSKPSELSNILEHGDRTEEWAGVKTSFSHLTLTCMCYKRMNCSLPVAVDLKGAIQEEGKIRGWTPLLHVTKDNVAKPCLSIQDDISVDDIYTEGCEYAGYSDSHLRVKNCKDGVVENLRVYRKSTRDLVARALSPDELLPESSDKEKMPLEKQLVDLLFGDLKLPQINVSKHLDIPIEVGPLSLGKFEVGPFEFKPFEIGPFDLGTFDIGPFDFGQQQLDAFDIGPIRVGKRKILERERAGPFDIGPIRFTVTLALPRPFKDISKEYEFGPYPAGPFDIGPYYTRPFELGPYPVGPIDLGTIKAGPFKVALNNVGPLTVAPPKQGPYELGPLEVEKIEELLPFDFEENISDDLEQAGKALLSEALDRIGKYLLPDTFKEARPLSQATMPDLMRVLLWFSVRRLEQSAVLLGDRPSPLVVKSTPVYADLVSSRPETSALAEIVSGMVTVSVAAFAFGWTLARSCRRGILATWKNEPSFLVGLAGASLACVAELFAYSERWMAEKDLSNWRESLVVVDTVASSRSIGNPLVYGRDGDMLCVTITTAELTSIDNDRLPWLYGGVAVLILSFVVGVALGASKKRQSGGSSHKSARAVSPVLAVSLSSEKANGKKDEVSDVAKQSITSTPTASAPVRDDQTKRGKKDSSNLEDSDSSSYETRSGEESSHEQSVASTSGSIVDQTDSANAVGSELLSSETSKINKETEGGSVAH